MSLILQIANSECKLEGLSRAQHSQLRDLLFYEEDPNAIFFSKNWRSPKRYLIDKKGVFPTGLLYLVLEWCQYNKYHLEIKDLRKRPDTTQILFSLKSKFAPYPEQIEAANKCLQEGRGIVCAPTGLGKSLIAALIVFKLQVRTLIVVPSIELKKQLIEAFRGLLGETAGKGENIWIENVQALDPKEKIKGYDCAIIDEFHHSAASSYRELNKKAWADIFFKFGLTATPFRSQDRERLLLESVLSKVIYRVEYPTAVSKGYICPLEVYYIETPRIKKTLINERYNQAYKDLVVDNSPRNQLIADILDKLISAKISTLCLVKEVKHAENIRELLKNECEFVKGDNDNNKELISKFTEKHITALLGTMGCVGEGIDTKSCEYVIIASPIKSKNQFMQCVGRVFRQFKGKESGKVILLQDFTHKWFREAFKQQRKILREEYNIEPIKINFDNQ